jgi:hypothetical protein
MAAKLFFFVAVPIVLLWMFLLWLSLPKGSTLFLAIFLIGALIFLWGFKTYRELRLLQDTPQISVRSVSMGRARLKGKATGEERLASPLTNQPCYYYRVHVERWDEAGDKSGWMSYKAKTEARRFYLDDGTGRVLVDPQGAELDVEYTFHAEIGPRSKNTRYVHPSLGVPGLAEAELRALVAANPKLTTGLLQSNDGPLLRPTDLPPAMAARINPKGSYRFTEHCLLADRECIVLGTCFENPRPKDEHDRNIITKGVNEKTFLITTKAKLQEEKRLRRRAVQRILLGAGVMVAVTAFAVTVAH